MANPNPKTSHLLTGPRASEPVTKAKTVRVYLRQWRAIQESGLGFTEVVRQAIDLWIAENDQD